MRFEPDNNNTLALTLFVLVMAAIGSVILLWVILSGTQPARGGDLDGPCLTQTQARAKYGAKAWLYWHGADHCWDNVKRYPTPQRQARSAKLKTVHENEYNELDAAADRDTYFDPGHPSIWNIVPNPRSRFAPWDERIGM